MKEGVTARYGTCPAIIVEITAAAIGQQTARVGVVVNSNQDNVRALLSPCKPEKNNNAMHSLVTVE